MCPTPAMALKVARTALLVGGLGWAALATAIEGLGEPDPWSTEFAEPGAVPQPSAPQESAPQESAPQGVGRAPTAPVQAVPSAPTAPDDGAAPAQQGPGPVSKRPQAPAAPETAVVTPAVVEKPLPLGSVRRLTTPYGTGFEAYVVGDARATRAAVLVHDEWGFNERLRLWARRIASLGYYVVAVDLYDGRTPTDVDHAEQVYGAIDPVWIEADLAGALDFLQKGGRSVVVVGWGRAAPYTRQLAQRHAGAVTGVVNFLDRGIEPAGLPATTVPLLALVTRESLLAPSVTAADQADDQAWDAARRFLYDRFN